MSPAVSPSPSPLSGSLLAVDRSQKRSGPESPSVRDVATPTGTSLWFGGQSCEGDALHESAGGVLSIETPFCVSLALLPAASLQAPVADWFAPSAVSVCVTVAGAPESASVQLHVSVTSPAFQPNALAAVRPRYATVGGVES